MPKLKNKVKQLPQSPGVYMFKNSAGEVLYVGKAKNLKKRVSSYFTKRTDQRQRTALMLNDAADLDFVVVGNETESLILENNLIKQYRPRYNVHLRDDKNYQFIQIDYSTAIPQISSARKIEGRNQKHIRYFGPYTSAAAVKKTLKLIKNIFQLCQNKKPDKKPCFAWHLSRCPGACIGKISIEEYKQTLKRVEEFLKYRQGQVLADLRAEMKLAAEKNQFEHAAVLRDKIRALLNIWEKQKIVSSRKENQDFIGLYKDETKAFVVIFLVREGKLIHKEEFELAHKNASDQAILERFITQYYMDASSQPKRVYVPRELSKIPGLALPLKRPQRGKKAKLVELACQNAKLAYEKSFAVFEKEKAAKQALEELARALKLKKAPQRIEAFDISNIQGRLPTGSMVVFTNGLPDKSQYRKFKIRTKHTPDDVAMMKEMIQRRFKHTDDSEWPLPDLVVVDGGKGQLNTAVSQIDKYQLKLKVLGLAKRLEEVYLPKKKQPIQLPGDSPALKLLQRIRDEAHRAALTFHKQRRSKAQIASQLDTIPGIGPKSKQKLLKKFGSLLAVKNASVEALASEIGLGRAKKIKENL